MRHDDVIGDAQRRLETRRKQLALKRSREVPRSKLPDLDSMTADQVRRELRMQLTALEKKLGIRPGSRGVPAHVQCEYCGARGKLLLTKERRLRNRPCKHCGGRLRRVTTRAATPRE